MIRLEICANGIKSLRNAMDGCAQCVELCEALEVGGLTPSFGTMAKAIDISFIPMRVLIRPRPGNYSYDEEEVEVMKTDIMLCKKLGFEGVVIGALDDEGMLDVDTLKSLMEAGEGMKFTFHRAIDACTKPFEAMEQLIELGFDKVLTSGGRHSAEEGIPMIAEMQLRYGDRIAIMPGGGVNLGNVKDILDQTGTVNVHASLGHWVPRFNEKLYPKQVDNTGASMVWTESNYEIIYEMEKLINP
ncbi:MAG: copper homeostasis protein CutC [Bacteroidales bacterium]|nr:copper homeostasis protein CutC [Bacteroidales bacterium]